MGVKQRSDVGGKGRNAGQLGVFCAGVSSLDLAATLDVNLDVSLAGFLGILSRFSCSLLLLCFFPWGIA